MTESFTIEKPVHFQRRRRGRKELRAGNGPAAPPATERVSRLARLLALAWRCDRLVRSGEIADYATLARLGQVTRARISQIMNLLHLAPDIQEEILFLSRPLCGRDPLQLRQLQPLTQVLDWSKQRRLWRELRRG
jgi:hypothetical protein